jgi:RsiW-degrading membrane proteinase PrsW (M82 family)
MSFVLAVLSVVCAAVPMLTMLAAVWWADRYDRAPLWLLLFTFLWGALGAVSLSLVGNHAFMAAFAALVGPEHAEALTAVVAAPLVEEPTKALWFLLLLRSRHFAYASDGFVYGAAAGLGFGMTENLVYFLRASSYADADIWAETVLARTFFSALLHACATSAVGAAVGGARYGGRPRRWLSTAFGFAVALGMHALWNGLLVLDTLEGTERWSSLARALFPFEVIVLVGVFLLSQWDTRDVLRRELSEEVARGVVPAADAAAVSGPWGRLRSGWVPEGVPREPYLRALTALARGRHHARAAKGPERARLDDEVERLRREVLGLRALAGAASATSPPPR